MPGVHQPHCSASASRNACCIGWSLPSATSPSMVTIFLPAAAPALVRHERVATPSSRTVHAAHCPSPQPYLVPVRSRSSRRTLSSERSTSASTRRLTPLMSSSVMRAIAHLLLLGSFLGLHLEGAVAADEFHADRHLGAGDLALIVQLELVAVEASHNLERHVVSFDLAFGDGRLGHELTGCSPGQFFAVYL